MVGGNCKTIERGEYRFDTGAHRFHDKNNKVTAELKALMGKDFLNVSAPSKIFKNGALINFPLNSFNLFRNLKFSSLINIIYENIFNRSKYFESPNNFKELANKKYGSTFEFIFIELHRKAMGL